MPDGDGAMFECSTSKRKGVMCEREREAACSLRRLLVALVRGMYCLRYRVSKRQQPPTTYYS